MTTSKNPLAEKVAYLSAEDRNIVLHALEKAIEWHEGQLRDSGEPYVTHPIAVAEYLTKLEARADTLAAALLHDVVEDERATMAQVEEEFGPVVVQLVDGVTKLSKVRYEGKRTERQLASLRKMMLSAHDDLRVIFIKLADRWHNAQSLSALPEAKQERIAQETLEIYVPFARLVGLWQLKTELENACFPLAFPEESTAWRTAVSKARSELLPERQAFVERVNAETTDEVEANIDIMSDYEVFTKFQGDINRVEESRSLDTVHIVVQKKEDGEMDCYRVLGEIHKQYPIATGSFRDYISSPQPNGYSALHTTIFLSHNHMVRLRIQTEHMYEYATNRKLSDWQIDPEGNVHAALGSLQSGVSDDAQYVQDLKNTVLKKRMSVFTTMGEIISLPEGSTGVDFAFAVNPEHIRYLEKILINGEPSQPTQVLSDGDTVELVLLQSQEVENGENGTDHKRMWLEKVKSVEAREGLKDAMKDTDEDKRNEQAKKMLEQELGKQKLPYKVIFRSAALQNKLAEELERESFAKLMEDLGTGEVAISAVVDVYKDIIQSPSSFPIRCLAFFGLLPRSRVLNKKAKVFDVDIYAEDRQGLIHDITQCFAKRSLNIAKFGVFALPNSGALYRIRLEVQNFEEFSELYDSLLQVPSVTRVLRKR